MNQMKKKVTTTDDLDDFQCDFCKKKFVSENNKYKHLCEPKRRYQQRGDKSVKLAFMIYQRFCKRHSNSKTPTLEDFEKKSLYSAFVGFATYLSNIRAINVIGFTDWLLTNDIGIDDWQKSMYYERYIKELSKTEPAMEALQRNIVLMEQWSSETGEPLKDFFHKISIPQALLWIKSGRLSPWVIFSAPEITIPMIKRMTAEQKEMMGKLIDEKFWEIKLERYPEEVEDIDKALKEICQ